MTTTTEPELKTSPDGLRYWDGGPSTDDHLAGGGHEQPLAPILRSQLRPGLAFWNVGAHVGGWALRALSLPEVHDVVAFEANPRTMRRLLENYVANGDRLEAAGAGMFTVVNSAVSDTTGDTMRMVDVNGKSTGGSTRIEAEEDVVLRDGSGPEVLRVTTVTLDDWWDTQSDEHKTLDHFGGLLANPGLLLIDVEGHEVEVLAGARALIEAHHPNLVIEVHDGHPGAPADLVPRLEALLTELGYSWSPENFYGDEVHWICGWSAFLEDEPEAVDVEFAPEGTDPKISPWDF